MTTDTHAALLAELPGEFRPQDRHGYVLRMGLVKYYWADPNYDDDYRRVDEDIDAIAHIERAAWKRVRAFLRTSTGDTHMAVTEYKGTITIDDGCDLIIGQGPDDATALLAACRWINEQEKR